MWYEFLKWCRTIHSWLGVIILPWVIVIALTGFYINHPQGFHTILGYEDISNADVASLAPVQVSQQLVDTIAKANWPDEAPIGQGQTRYRNRQMFAIAKPSGTIFIPVPSTNIYFVRDGMHERIVGIDGTIFRNQLPYPQMFRVLHEQGWLSSTFGTFFADLVALSMVLFSFTGLLMFFVPKYRKLKFYLQAKRAA